MSFILRNSAKATEERGMEWKRKTHLNLDFIDDLRILDKICKMNKLLEVLKVQGARTGLDNKN